MTAGEDEGTYPVLRLLQTMWMYLPNVYVGLWAPEPQRYMRAVFGDDKAASCAHQEASESFLPPSEPQPLEPHPAGRAAGSSSGALAAPHRP